MAGEEKETRQEIPLFCDFVEQRYLPFVQQNKRTWKIDRANLERHILPYLGSYRLSDINSGMLMNFAASLQLSGLAYSSCRRHFAVAKYILNCAVRWGVLESDTAFKAANMPQEPGKCRKPALLDASELVKLLELLNDHDSSCSANAIRLMLLTGASKSEILNARWENVDFARGVLTAPACFTGRPRLIPLNNEAQKLIHSLPRRNDIPWLFFTRTGKRLTDITRYWFQIREEFGRPDLQLSDLRRSFANFLLEMGASQRDLRAILGHYKPGALELVSERQSTPSFSRQPERQKRERLVKSDAPAPFNQPVFGG